MEKPIYPSRNMRITQGYEEGTHKNSYAIDDAGLNTGIEPIRAPYTGIIKKIYTPDANEVWLESIEPVEYPDGTKDYMTILFAHCNDVSNLFVGKRIAQGENFYSEGTKGNATGNHCHIECGKGKFTGTGWFKNASGYYSINNPKKPEECLWLDKEVKVLNNHNYNFKRIPEPKVEPPITTSPTVEAKPETPTPKPETPAPKPENNQSDTKKLIFTCPKTDLYGVYLKENQKLYLEE